MMEPIPVSTPAAMSSQRRTYSSAETVFAWLALLAGYAFWRMVPAARNPLGAFLFIAVLYGATMVVLALQGIRLRGLPLCAALSALALSLTLPLCSDAMLHTVSTVYALGAYLYMVYAAGNNGIGGFTNLMAADLFRAVFVLPFASFEHLFYAVGYGRGRVGAKLLLKIVLGVVITIVPTTIVLLLLSYDSGFTDLMNRWFAFDFGELILHGFSLFWGIPVGMYVYSAYVSSMDKRCGHIVTADACTALWYRVKRLPTVTAVVAMLPILIMYVVFFVSQWKYYISGFWGELPAETIYSEYAREGFFQLCAVSMINFLLLSLLSLFTARKGDRPSVAQRILTIVTAIFTLILISTALSKMFLYIDSYGLTHKRVYATWFMVVLSVLFLLVLVQQFVRRLPLLSVGLVAVIALYAVLSFSGVDSLIARYNVDRYLSSTLITVDVNAMEESDDAAIPELVRLAKAMDQRSGRNIATYRVIPDSDCQTEEHRLYNQVARSLHQAADRDDAGFFSLTVPYLRARAALRDIGLLPNS